MENCLLIYWMIVIYTMVANLCTFDDLYHKFHLVYHLTNRTSENPTLPLEQFRTKPRGEKTVNWSDHLVHLGIAFYLNFIVLC